MAQDTIDKIINIQFNYNELVQGWQKASREIEANKKNLAELKQEYKNGEMTASEYNRALLEITSTTKALTAEKKAYEKEIQQNIKIETQATGSLNQLRANLQKMTAEYNALSAAAREGDVGKRMAADIKSQQEAVNEAEMALGNYRSQVGSYKDSILQALGINQQFTKSISMLKSPLGVVAGAAAACVAVFKLFKSSIHETQSTGDAFDYAMAGWRTTWDLFKKSVSAVDFSIFIRNAVEAREAGVKLAQVLDELFERTNSITLQEGAWKKERAELEVTMRDVTKSYEERLEAGNKLLEGDQKIADQRKKVAEDERNAQIGLLFDLTKTRKYASEEEKAAAREEFAARIQNYNLTLDQIRAANNYKKAVDDLAKSRLSMGYNKYAEDAGNKAIAESYDTLIKSITTAGVSMEDAKKQAADYVDFVTQYNLTNDKQVKAYVDAQQKVYEADAQVIIQNKSNLTTLKSLEKQQTDEAKKGAEERAKIRYEALISENKEYKKRAQLEEQLQQARQDMIRKTYELQAELEDAAKDFDKEWLDEMQRMMDRRGREYQNRLMEATLSGGALGAAKETIAIAKEQLALLDNISDNEALINRLGWDDVELQRQRLKLRMKIADAENNIAREQERTKQQAAQQTAQALGRLSSMTGAFSSMFEALGGEGERYAEFAKALAVFQVVLAQAEAIANAVASASEAPWFMLPITIAASIATVIAAIAQATKITDSAETPKYASGGLVTGPGTGTSDSIPAMLSNGEAVMTAQAVNDWGAMLSAMNVSSGGNAIEVGNLPRRGDGMRGMERMLERALMNMPAPVVAVTDINKGQRRVQVMDTIGRLGRKKYA